MLYPPLSELMKKVDNRFTLCIVVAKRARRLLEGDRPLLECNSKKPVSIATNEVCEGKITYIRTRP